MLWDLENPNCKDDSGDPSLDSGVKETTQSHCLGSAMPLLPSFGVCFGTERSSSDKGKANVAPQDEKSLSFPHPIRAMVSNGTLACGLLHIARVDSSKGYLCICVLCLNGKQNTSRPNLQCV